MIQSTHAHSAQAVAADVSRESARIAEARRQSLHRLSSSAIVRFPLRCACAPHTQIAMTFGLSARQDASVGDPSACHELLGLASWD
jgi:hypothetical protein